MTYKVSLIYCLYLQKEGLGGVTANLHTPLSPLFRGESYKIEILYIKISMKQDADFRDVHSATKPQPNNHPNWGCLKSLINVPFADYPGLHYTVSRLMKKKVSVARLKSSNTFAFLPVWVDLIVRNCIHTLSSTLYINRLAK